MNDRIRAAQAIGEIKKNLEQPAFYRPEREAQVLRQLKDLNEGPMGDSDIDSLFREIMSIARGTEADFSVSLLGPAGTFSEAATLRHFGSTIDLVYFSSIEDIFRAAETGQTNFAVVPIENSTEGGVNSTLDRLASTSLLVCGEIYLKVHHNLISQARSLESVRCVMAHPQALGQCRNWLRQNMPEVDLVSCSSNAAAVEHANEDPTVAAIAASAAAKKFNLGILQSNIEDEPGNTTRFLVLSDRNTPISGHDKTSLLVSGRNRPGALFHLLKPLVNENLDMTKIESRPSRSGLWEYIFFVDIKGHIDEPVVARAINAIKKEAGLFRHLGSYPDGKQQR